MSAAPPSGGFACALDAWLAGQCGASPEDLPRRLAAAHMAALRRVLRHAAGNSRFYARLLRGHYLDVSGPEELARLPFTRPEDLARWEDFLCVSRGAVERMVTLRTSGTTGAPKRLAFTEADLARTRQFFAVGMRGLVGPGQRLVVLLPGAERPDGVADLLRQALEADGVEVLALPPELSRGSAAAPWGAAAARQLAQLRPHCVVAAPAQLARLLPQFPDTGPSGLAGILSSAEPLPPGLARVLRERWGCRTLDHYGLTETGYGCAVECPAHDGYHLRALDVYVEIVAMTGDRVLPPGEEGEVVITTLQREAMPLVRYRTGDVASLLPGPCACGSPLPRLGPVRGRILRDAAGAGPRIVRLPKGAHAAARPGSRREIR